MVNYGLFGLRGSLHLNSKLSILHKPVARLLQDIIKVLYVKFLIRVIKDIVVAAHFSFFITVRGSVGCVDGILLTTLTLSALSALFALLMDQFEDILV